MQSFVKIVKQFVYDILCIDECNLAQKQQQMMILTSFRHQTAKWILRMY